MIKLLPKTVKLFNRNLKLYNSSTIKDSWESQVRPGRGQPPALLHPSGRCGRPANATKQANARKRRQASECKQLVREHDCKQVNPSKRMQCKKANANKRIQAGGCKNANANKRMQANECKQAQASECKLIKYVDKRMQTGGC